MDHRHDHLTRQQPELPTHDQGPRERSQQRPASTPRPGSAQPGIRPNFGAEPRVLCAQPVGRYDFEQFEAYRRLGLQNTEEAVAAYRNVDNDQGVVTTDASR